MGLSRLGVAVALLGLAATGLCAPAGTSAVAARPSCGDGPDTAGDVTYGTPCDDRIVVRAGVARVEGGAGDDVIVAPRSAADGSCPEGCRLGVGSQTFDGGPGDDIVYGERGNDVLRGGEGDDRLYGGIGDDRLQGGPGDDFLAGGFGADGIDGEAGNDFDRGDGTVDQIADTGPPTDVDTLSYALGATPGFPDKPKSYPAFSAHNGFPDDEGERGVYLNLTTGVGDDGVAPDGGGVDEVAGDDFERVIGTPFSDYVVGAKDGLAIYGGGGADVLIAEGTGAHIDGGADGDDCVGAATAAGCESTATTGPVVPRDTAKVSVGLIAPPAEVGETEIYVVGGTGADQLTAAYSPGAATFTLAVGSFDLSPSASAGCATPDATHATCPLPEGLDTVLLAGMGGADEIQVSGFPSSVSVAELGGIGDDTLTGGEESEDMLVDGPGDDVLSSLGGDDILTNNGGADQLSAGDGNDLFLSNSICEGDVLNGGEGRDNPSWAKFKAGVEARIGAGDAGRPGPGGAPECAGGTLDSLQQDEDLEGTGSADVLQGGPESNQLLGHAGEDSYFAEAGDDTILANSGDFDPTIDCGADDDLAVIDLATQIGETAAPDCESVREAAPNSFQAEAELPPEILPPPPPPPERPAPPSNRFRLARVGHDRRHGLATLHLHVPGPGRVALLGKGVRPISRHIRAGAVDLVVRPLQRLARALARRGRATVVVKISFEPDGGAARSERRTLTLSRTVR